MIMKKFIPVAALTAITTLMPTTNASAHWCGPCGWRFWVPFGIGVGVPLAVATTRAVYGPPYYRGYYGPGPYYYGGRAGAGYSVGADVQSALARKGFYHGAIDGIIGPQSRDAIRSYQAARGLPVTGQIDRSLLRSLRLA
jgi:hypothetical protein